MILSNAFYGLSRWLGQWPFRRIDLKRYLSETGIVLKGKTLNAGSGSEIYDISAEYLLNIDIDMHSRPHIASDIHDIPLQDEEIDNVIAICVIEHVKKPEKVVKELFRVMRSGGVLIIEVPFINPVHASPNDYHRFTIEGMKEVLHDNGFLVRDVKITQPISYGMLWILWKWAKELDSYFAQYISLLFVRCIVILCGVNKRNLWKEGDLKYYAQFIIAAEKK